MRWLSEAYAHHMGGELDDAEDGYKRSIQVEPTAEAHTYLGWTYSMRGEYLAAIHECEIAIRVDPQFGNPYNDIGCYLIEMGRWVEAESWLKKATDAPRYEARHYPWMNLGRIYEREMDWERAKRAFMKACVISPGYFPAMMSLRRMMSQFN